MASLATCKFFASGYCMRGENCRYSHEETTVKPQVSVSGKKQSEATASTTIQDARSQIACYHYSRGNCRNGSTCPFSHTAEKQKKKAEEPDLDPEVCFLSLQVSQCSKLTYDREGKIMTTSQEISEARWQNLTLAHKYLRSCYQRTFLPLE